MWFWRKNSWKRILSCVLTLTLTLGIVPAFQVAAADETVSIKDHVNNSTNAGNSGVNGFYFKTDGDALDYANDWSIRYGEAVSGGITVEGAKMPESSGDSDGGQEEQGALPVSGAELVGNTTIVSADGSTTLTAGASSEIADGVDCGDPGTMKKDWVISLPLINYTKYESVSMEFKGNAAWQYFGFSTSNWMSDGGSAAFAGTITITNSNDGTLKAVMEATSHQTALEETITDASIINGTKSLTLHWNNGASYRHMHIGPITGVAKESTDDAGTQAEVILASGSTLVGDTAIVSADGSTTLTASASSEIANGVDCGDPGTMKKDWVISLPAIDFTKYESVSMEFKGNAAWQYFGFSASNWLGDSGSAAFAGTITITNSDDGTLKAVMEATSHQKTLEEIITDASIINGTKSLTLHWNNGAAYRHMHIGPIKGVLKENNEDIGEDQSPEQEENDVLVTMLKISKDTYYVDLIVAGVTPINGTKVTLQGTYTDGTDNVTFRKAIFGFDGTKWILEEAEQAPTPVSVTIQDHKYNETNEEDSGIKGFYFATENDPLTYNADGSVRYEEAGGIVIAPEQIEIGSGDSYACVQNVKRMIEIPKIDYSQYESVSFSWGTTGWTQAGYGEDLWFYGGESALGGIVTIVNNGLNSLEVTMEESLVGKGSYTVTVNNDAIYSGTEAFALAANNLVGTQTFTVGKITATESNEWENLVISMLKLDEGTYFVDLAKAGVLPAEGMKVIISGIYTDGTAAVQFEEEMFQFDGTKWAIYEETVIPNPGDDSEDEPGNNPGEEPTDEPVDLTNHKKTTVYITDHENNANNWGGSGVNGFYFKTSRDPLAFGTDWTVRYKKPAAGGVYVDGSLQEVQLIKYAEGNYYVPLAESQIAVKTGTQVVIDGAFYDAENIVTFKKATFTFNGEIWTVETEIEPVDLSNHETATAIIKDHQNNLAGFGGSGENGFYFKTDSDPLAYKDDWSIRYVTPATGGVYVDGILKPVQLIKYAADSYYVGLVDSGFKATKGMQIVIEGVFYDDKYAVTFKKTTFTFDGSRWTFEGEKEYVDLSKHKKVTIEVSDSDMNLGNSSEKGFYFKAEDCPLAFGSDWQTRYFVPAEGGIYLDGELKSVQLIKHKENQYYVALVDSGLVDFVQKGTKVTIDGSFYDDKYVVTFEKATFVFDGRFWMMEQEGADIEVKDMSEVTTYDLYEFTKTLSTTVCRKSSTVIGGLDDFRNTSIKMKVDVNRDAWEFLIGLGKNSTNNMWLGDGYQIVIQPANELILIRSDVSTNVAAGYCEIPEEFILEIGMVDVATMDGKYYGTRVFVKIDGVEVASWVDSNTARVIGRNIMYYAPDTVNAMLSTAKELTTLPIDYVVDGEEKGACDLITPSQVILDEANYYVVKKSSGQNTLVKDVSLKINGEDAKRVAENSYSYTFLIYPKAETDKLTIIVETAERTVDAPTKILDLYDVAGSIATDNTVIGNMVADGEALRANVAMRFVIELPDEYKESAIGIAAAVDEIFRTKGYTILFSPEGVSIRHGAAHNELAYGSTSLFKAGASVYVECGIVKCYEDGIYKYDSIYIKAGDNLENLRYVTWYDSTRRGGYDSGVLSNGVATLRTTEQRYTLTDISATSQKEKVASVERHGETFYQVYYPDVILSGESARIVLYTKEETEVHTMTVNGKKLEPTSQQDGVYVYVLEAVTKDTVFAYTIKED